MNSHHDSSYIKPNTNKKIIVFGLIVSGLIICYKIYKKHTNPKNHAIRSNIHTPDNVKINKHKSTNIKPVSTNIVPNILDTNKDTDINHTLIVKPEDSIAHILNEMRFTIKPDFVKFMFKHKPADTEYDNKSNTDISISETDNPILLMSSLPNLI